MNLFSQMNYLLSKMKQRFSYISIRKEKNFSNFCCTGLYYFRSLNDYTIAFEYILSYKINVNGEYYIAPMYNYLIQSNKLITYNLITKKSVLFSGTP